MLPRRLPPLLWCGLFALPTAGLAAACLPAATVAAVLGLLFARCSRHRCRLAGLCGLPALLAAIEAPKEPLAWPRAGPAHVEGAVDEIVRMPAQHAAHVWLADGRRSLRIQFDTDIDVLPGDRLSTLARISAPAAPDLPPSLHGIAETLRVTPGPWSVRRLAAASRRALELQLLQLVPGEHGAMLATLVLGRGTKASADLVAAHQATGLSHLLAVSGAHAAMLAFLLGLRGRGSRLEASWNRTVVVLSLLFVYAAITGNEPPVLRAVITCALAALATRLGRPCGLWTGLLAPALATCLLEPRALLSPSFLLSYAAVAGLALAGAPRGNLLQRWLLGSLRSSAWATLLTAPLTLHFFGQLAPWTVLLTPLLAPIVATLLLGGLVTAVLGCSVPALAVGMAPGIGFVAELYGGIVRAADHLPGTPVHALVVPAGSALALAAGLAWLAIERLPDRRGAALAAGMFVVPYFAPLTASPPPRLWMFAVGHGQACLLRTAQGHQTAIDCGSASHPQLAARRLASALARRRLDLLVVTHADADHHNGVPALLRYVPIDSALLPASLHDSDLERTLRAEGTAVTFVTPGGRVEPMAHLLVTAPALPAGTSDNDQSLWIRATVGRVSVLLTGDAEAAGVGAALAQGTATPCDVLVLPHHGRANPMASELLRRVRPRACLASAACADAGTALGPAARGFGADLWVTGQHGTIEVCGEDPARVIGHAGGRPIGDRTAPVGIPPRD